MLGACTSHTKENFYHLGGSICVPFSFAEIYVSYFEHYSCIGYIVHHQWFLILDSCLHGYQFEYEMVKVFQFETLANIDTPKKHHGLWRSNNNSSTDDWGNFDRPIMYGISERAWTWFDQPPFTWLSVPTEDILPLMPRLMLLKLVINLTNDDGDKITKNGSFMGCFLPPQMTTNSNYNNLNEKKEIIDSKMMMKSDNDEASLGYMHGRKMVKLSSNQCRAYSHYYECDYGDDQVRLGLRKEQLENFEKQLLIYLFYV